jgi:hypothetical protein
VIVDFGLTAHDRARCRTSLNTCGITPPFLLSYKDFTAVALKLKVFLDVTSCSLVCGPRYQRFGGTY